MKSVSEFRRRLLPGSKWLMTNTLTGSQFIRVVKRRSNGTVVFYHDGPGTIKESWLAYPKASECEYDNGSIKIRLGDGHYLSYKQLEKPSGQAPPT